MDRKHKSHCPVCLMVTDTAAIEYLYQGLNLKFCSEQCMQRFVANPELYIGGVRKPSVKYRIKNIKKHRVIYLKRNITDNVANRICQTLNTMMGIHCINIHNNKVEITYDLLQATLQQIETQIELVEPCLSLNWFRRMHRAFIHYKEETELENLEQEKKYSCHNPPE